MLLEICTQGVMARFVVADHTDLLLNSADWRMQPEPRAETSIWSE